MHNQSNSAFFMHYWILNKKHSVHEEGAYGVVEEQGLLLSEAVGVAGLGSDSSSRQPQLQHSLNPGAELIQVSACTAGFFSTAQMTSHSRTLPINVIMFSLVVFVSFLHSLPALLIGRRPPDSIDIT